MKKILSLLCLFMLAISSAWADDVKVTWAMGESTEAVVAPDGYATGAIVLGEGLSNEGAYTWSEIAFTKFQATSSDKGSNSHASAESLKKYVDFKVTPVGGKFTPTKVSFDIIKIGTGDPNAYVDFIDGEGNTITVKDNATIRRNQDATDAISHSYTISGAKASDKAATLRILVGKLANNKQVGIANVVIEGIWTSSAKTVTFINDANWEKVYVWAWNEEENFTGGEWPGVEMTEKDVEGNYTWSTMGNPKWIIFSDGTTQTSDLDFKDGGKYNSTGRIITLNDYSATFTTDGWTDVWAYVWNSDDSEHALKDWPGTQLEGTNGVFTVAIQAEEAPAFIIFHNNAGQQTENLVFEDGKAYEYMMNTYTVTFKTDTWENVYAYAWNGSGDGTEVLTEAWPGQQLTAENGIYTFTIKGFSAPESILFNNGGSGEGNQTGDYKFVDGKVYQYMTSTPLYTLTEGTVFTAGQTVEIKDGGDVVATITYSEAGGNDFNAVTTELGTVEGWAAFAALTTGNETNGNVEGGTFYTIVPKYDGTITVAVRLNGGKKFHISEDGTDLAAYNGWTIAEAANTTYDFAVKAGSAYKIWCDGSKLGFFGFDYKFTKPEPALNTYTATFKTNLAWESVYAYAWSGEGDATVEFLGSWPGTEVTDVDDTNDDYDIYKLTFQAATAPEKIIFSDGVGGKVGKTQTEDLVFVDGQEYSLIYTPSALMEEAIALALDDEAVAVGKLLAAIEYAYDNNDESQLQAAIDQFKADNADQEKDETAKVKTDGWKNFNGDPAGVCATQFAPAITTYDGREAQLAEVYEQNDQAVGRTGTIIYQDITGLTNGQYKVGFYGNAFFTDGRGMTSDMADGAEDVAYVFANDEKEFITAKIATSTTENNFRQFDVEVTDGTIKLGMGKEKAGTNWHTMQIYQLTWFTTAKEVYASLKKELDAMLFAAAFELDDEYMTNGKEEFQAAFDAAKAAKASNMLNIPELEAEIAKFKAAAAAFQKANYFIDFAAGEYYIIDAETDLKFAAGHNYGTRGIINEMGLDLTLTPYTESRTVTIDSRVSNGGNSHFLGQNLYMDSSEWGWALQYRGFGFYILEPNSGKYINIDANNNLVLSDTPREFIIVTKEGVLAERLEELAEGTTTNPKDATFLLQNPNFNRNDQRVEAWKVTFTDGNNSNLNGGNQTNNCAESYHAAFNVMQTVSGAPAGFYQMTAQGFYRQDTYEGDAPAAPVFFANEINGDVPALLEGGPNGMSTASEAFTNGDYTIDPITFEVKDDGMMYVGVTASTTTQWVIWDNFQLKYFGKENPTTGISTVVDNNNQNNAIYNLNGQRVEKAQKGLYIINGRKQVVR